MVLQYLPAIAKGLQLAGGAAALGGLFSKPKQTAAETGQAQSVANQNRLIQALLNPDDPVFKNINAQEQATIRGNASMLLEDLIRSDRRQQLLGRQSFFNPERRDETINQYMTNVNSAAQGQGRNNAIDRILSAIKGYSGVSDQYGNMIPAQMARQGQNAARLPTALGAASDFGNSVYSSLNSGGLSNILSRFGGNREVEGLPWLS